MANFFFYNARGEKVGPMTGVALKALAQQGVITPGTMIENEAGKTSLAANVKGLTFQETLPRPSEPVVPIAPSPVAQPARAVPVPHSAPQAMNTSLEPVRRKDRITFWTMLCIASFVLCSLLEIAYPLLMASIPYLTKDLHEKSSTTVGPSYVVGVVVRGHQTVGPSYKEVEAVVKARINTILLVLTLIIGPSYICCYYTWLRRMWEEVPQRFARTSPGNAALFALIPFYNWYWNFTVFCGLNGDMNKTTESYGLGSRFEVIWIKLVCIWWVIVPVWWVGVKIYGRVFFYCYTIRPELFHSPTPDLSIMMVIVNNISIFIGVTRYLFPLIGTVITIATYWILRKNVLEFIDIKASAGE